MAKKKLLKKTTGFDIMYRVVTAVLAAMMFPVLYFSNILYYEVDNQEASGLIGLLLSLFGQDGSKLGLDGSGTMGYLSLSEFASEKKGLLASFLSDSLSNPTEGPLNPVFKPVIATAVLIGIALVVALVIIGFAAFSNNSKVITCLSAGGTVIMGAAYFTFNRFFAQKMISGEIALSDIIGAAGAFTDLLGIKIITLRLDSAFNAVFFLMIAVFIWSLAVVIVNAGDEKKKSVKKMKKIQKAK